MPADIRATCVCSEPYNTPEPTCPEHGIQHEPDDTDHRDPRARMAEAIVSHEWDDFPRSAHGDHNYYGACAICQGGVPRIAEVALAALAEDPGDLPKRMAEAMRVALVTWSEGAQNEHLAVAALSVRDELVAHLAARAAKAEARVGHAEAGAQRSSERLAKVQQELAEVKAERDVLKAADERVRNLDDPYPCGSVYAVPHGDGGWRSVLPVADLRAALNVPVPSEVVDA
jgi:hypothetical protein